MYTSSSKLNWTMFLFCLFFGICSLWKAGLIHIFIHRVHEWIFIRTKNLTWCNHFWRNRPFQNLWMASKWGTKPPPTDPRGVSLSKAGRSSWEAGHSLRSTLPQLSWKFFFRFNNVQQCQYYMYTAFRYYRLMWVSVMSLCSCGSFFTRCWQARRGDIDVAQVWKRVFEQTSNSCCKGNK